MGWLWQANDWYRINYMPRRLHVQIKHKYFISQQGALTRSFHLTRSKPLKTVSKRFWFINKGWNQQFIIPMWRKTPMVNEMFFFSSLLNVLKFSEIFQDAKNSFVVIWHKVMGMTSIKWLMFINIKIYISYVIVTWTLSKSKLS